ncbi:MAG: OmpA family protein [Candidatus Polarisedimenticolaceae bacterium]|nr:OmpA family protein [Candidatus Polarisedimenticolaceae bacterium]
MHTRWLILLLLPLSAWGAGNRVYMTDIHNSEWRFSGDKLYCEMSHEIKDYGVAHFVQKAGGYLSLYVDVKRAAIKKSSAKILETMPAWVPGNPDPFTELIKTAKGSQPFKLDHQQSAWMLNTLESGRFGSFTYQDWDTSRHQVRVSLNTVNFREAFGEFRTCTNTLLSYTFNDIRQLDIHFKSDAHTLTKKYRKSLDRITEYLKLSSETVNIKIYGHTDSIHSRRYNHFLSQRRANSVYNYLVKSGVPKSRLKKRVYGERKPLASNRTLAGRAKNRRVELLLELG